MELTGSQKTKWYRLKGEIIKRPFLAYAIGLKKEEIDSLFSESLPTLETIDRIDRLLLSFREQKVERLRVTLTKVVGPRGSAQFAEKIGTDSMTIKYIIDKKSIKIPSHDLISKIEIFLSYTTDFEVSLEYQNDLKKFLPDKIDNLKLKTNGVITNLSSINFNFDKFKIYDKKTKKPYLPDKWEITRLQSVLAAAIIDVQNIKIEVDAIVENLID